MANTMQMTITTVIMVRVGLKTSMETNTPTIDDHCGQHLGHALADHLPQGIRVIGVNTHDVPMGFCVKITDGQMFHVTKQVIQYSRRC